MRSWVLPAPNRGFSRRIANHASSALTALLASPKVRGVDVVVGETPPLFTAGAAVLIARAHRAKLLLNVADLWPESAVQLGMLRNRHAIRAAELLERFAYANSAMITVPTAGMRRILIEQGHPPDRVVHLPNAVDTDRFTPQSTPSERLTNVLYSGTVGLAQGVGTLLDAAEILARGASGMTVRVVGDGAEREDLQRAATERALTNVAFSGRLPATDIPGVIAGADIAVMSLVDVPLFEDAVPTKLLEYMAAGKPVVAAASGEAARVVERAGCGIACAPENPEAMADALLRIAADPHAAFAMGQAGRRYAEAHVSRRAFVDRLEALALAAIGERADGDASADAESQRIAEVYGAYAHNGHGRQWGTHNPGNERIITGFYERLDDELRRLRIAPGDPHRLLDVGCGEGDLLARLHARGAPAGALIGVDLLADRVAAGRARFPELDLQVADARALPLADAAVDTVVLSTVLSSIVDGAIREQVARECLRVLRPGGAILCYDARTPNPRNPAVRAIGRPELRRLFPGCAVEAQSLTLLPPLARRLGPATGSLYGPLTAAPFLRTHLLATIRPAS